MYLWYPYLDFFWKRSLGRISNYKFKPLKLTNMQIISKTRTAEASWGLSWDELSNPEVQASIEWNNQLGGSDSNLHTRNPHVSFELAFAWNRWKSLKITKSRKKLKIESMLDKGKERGTHKWVHTCGCIPTSVSMGLMIMPPPIPSIPPNMPASNAIKGNTVYALEVSITSTSCPSIS